MITRKLLQASILLVTIITICTQVRHFPFTLSSTLEEEVKARHKEDAGINQNVSRQHSSSVVGINEGDNSVPLINPNVDIKRRNNQPKIYTNATERRKPKGINYTDDMAHSFEAIYNNITSKYCLKAECIQEIANDIARTFPDRTNKEEWCIPQAQRGFPTNTTNSTTTTITSRHHRRLFQRFQRKHWGLILVKVPKAASSTAAAVVLRLGHRHNCNMHYVHWEHQRAHQDYAHRNRQRSFMLASVRDPAQQMISYVFWQFVTKKNLSPGLITDSYLMPKVVHFSTILGNLCHYQGGLQTQFTALEDIPRNSAWDRRTKDIINPQHTIARVKAILDGYDFILVVERMDESLVALALLLDVPIGDVVVTSSKVSSASSSKEEDEGTNGQKEHRHLSYAYAAKLDECLPVRSPMVSSHLSGYLKSDLFRSQVYGDLILNAAANRSLDLTIERLGVDRFYKALKEYKYWKQKEKEECVNRIHFPCSREGVPQVAKAATNCYARDLGCGHQCVDEMLAREGE